MTAILVLADHTDDRLREGVLETITAARELSGEAVVHAIWIGAQVPEPVLSALSAHGVSRVHAVSTPGADPRLTGVQGAAVAAVREQIGANLVLAVSTFENKEVAAHVAVATGAGVITDAVAVRHLADRVVAGKAVLAGTWTTRAAVRTELAVVTLKAGATVARPVDQPEPAQVVPVEVDATSAVRGIEVVDYTPAAASDRPDLGAADVVVVGGRGTEGDFGPLEALADVLGAAVGATRVATDEGWIGQEAQIGQTGVSVSPRLYLGAGVSGAVHHRGGMQASGTIVAINNDPDAPIFEIADYGIVGDLFAVLPALTDELRRLS